MNKKLFLLSIVLLFLQPVEIKAQITKVAKGWSQNSVNAVVFRKNSVVSYKDKQYLAYYDAEGYLVLAKRKLNSDKWKFNKTDYQGKVKDAHCSISIMIDGEGYLHIAWNHHNSKLLYAKSKKPESIILGEPQSMIGENETRVTYPEFYKFPNGNLFFVYREGNSGSGNIVINKYDTPTQKWTRVHDQIIDGEKERNAYWQADIDSKGTFHISWVWRETGNVSSNHDMCYAKTNDYGKTWVTSDGEKYDLPITQASAEYVTKIPQNSNLINQTSMYADENGVPYIATYFSTPSDTIPQFYMMYKGEDSWKTVKMTNRQIPFSLQGGGTKKIPISRPQILVDNKGDKTQAILIYRDIEYDNKAIVATSQSPDFKDWSARTVTDFSVGSWEPSFDTTLWKDHKKLHLFVQRVGQGDGESLENLPPQFIEIHEVDIEEK